MFLKSPLKSETFVYRSPLVSNKAEFSSWPVASNSDCSTVIPLKSVM